MRRMFIYESVHRRGTRSANSIDKSPVTPVLYSYAQFVAIIGCCCCLRWCNIQRSPMTGDIVTW